MPTKCPARSFQACGQCAAEDPQWIGRTSENECPKFVCVSGTWYDAHPQSTQTMKQQHRNSGDAEKREPSRPVLQNPLVGMIRVCLLLEMVLRIKELLFRFLAVNMQPNHFCATSVVIVLRQLGFQAIQQFPFQWSIVQKNKMSSANPTAPHPTNQSQGHPLSVSIFACVKMFSACASDVLVIFK